LANIVLTGATGFIGRRLAQTLIDRGYKVHTIIRHASARDLGNIRDLLNKAVLLTADLTDYHSVRNAIRSANPDYVCHLGALTPVRYSFEHPFENEETNYKGTMNIVHALLETSDFKSRRLLFASTAEVYGWQEKSIPFTEDLPLHPASPYAVSKAAADMYIRMAGEVYGLNYTVMRPSNSYGRIPETGFIVEYLITAMLKNDDVYIGTPDSIRDYMHVDDHVNAYVTAIENRKAERQVYNASTGIPTSNKELAEKIAKHVSYEKPIIFGSYPPGYPQRPTFSDPPYLVLNNSRIQRELKWKPQRDLDQGLQIIIRQWKDKFKNER
jgi:nucleoside-diphosphate-sugar epimerase